MKTRPWSLPIPIDRLGVSKRRARQTNRLVLHCESLETRQLLSIGQTGFAAGLLVNPFVASAQLSTPPAVSNYTSTGYSNITIDFEFGSLGGLNQIQIVILVNAPAFSPAPASSFAGSGPGLGTLTGTTSNPTTGNSQSGLSVNPVTTSTPSITPLNPSLTSNLNTTTTTNLGGPTISVVPLPLAPLAVHLGTSNAPATTITDSTQISNLDEQPPAITHFGQADTFVGRRLFMERLYLSAPSSSLIDEIEPFGPIVPIKAPAARPAPQGAEPQLPDAGKVRALPPLSDATVDAALDLTDARVLTRSRDGETAEPDDQFSSTNTSWSFSALFGAAVVATGGYHLAMREVDRFRGRAIPRWQGAERPYKRKAVAPSR